MPDEQKQGEQETSPSPLAQAIASSPEVQQEVKEQLGTETTATPQEAEAQVHEPPEEHPRFKEVIEQRNWYRQQLEKVIEQQQIQQPLQQPIDPYANMTPDEERFWRMQRQIAREEAEKVFGKVTPVIDAGRMELAQMKVQQFRTIHPDVKPNSPEEIMIAEKIQIGYLPEDAYRVIMWEKKVAETEKQATQSVKQRIETKKQANVEQSSISNVLPTKEKFTLRQRIEKAAQEAGI